MKKRKREDCHHEELERETGRVETSKDEETMERKEGRTDGKEGMESGRRMLRVKKKRKDERKDEELKMISQKREESPVKESKTRMISQKGTTAAASLKMRPTKPRRSIPELKTKPRQGKKELCKSKDIRQYGVVQRRVQDQFMNSWGLNIGLQSSKPGPGEDKLNHDGREEERFLETSDQ